MDQGKPLLIAPDLHLKDLEQARFLNHPLATSGEGRSHLRAKKRRTRIGDLPLFRCQTASAPVLTMRSSGFGDAVKELLCGFSTDSAKDKEMGVQRSHSWEPVKMQTHPRQKAERDATFARKKIQRASLRAHLREKYNLPKNPADEKQLEASGAKPQLPRDVLSIVHPNPAFPLPPKLPSFGGIDFDSLPTTLHSPAQSFSRLGQCHIM